MLSLSVSTVPSDGDQRVTFRLANPFGNTYPIPDVSVFVTDVAGWDELLDDTGTSIVRFSATMGNDLRDRTLSFGPTTLAVNGTQEIGTLPALQPDHLRYTVWMLGRGLASSQQLSYRLVEGDWLRASRAYGPGTSVRDVSVQSGYPKGAKGEPLW